MAESASIKQTATIAATSVTRSEQVTYTRRRNRAEHLMNKGIEDALKRHPLYSQDGKGDDADIVVKYFNPYGRGTWYVLEGEKREDGDWELYGIADLGYGQEYGYFMLSELENLRPSPWGGIERDMYFGKKKVRDIRR